MKDKYMVIITGLHQSIGDHQSAQMDQISKVLKLSPEMQGYIIGGKPIIAAKNISDEKAYNLVKKLTNLGLKCVAREMSEIQEGLKKQDKKAQTDSKKEPDMKPPEKTESEVPAPEPAPVIFKPKKPSPGVSMTIDLIMIIIALLSLFILMEVYYYFQMGIFVPLIEWWYIVIWIITLSLLNYFYFHKRREFSVGDYFYNFIRKKLYY